VSRPSFFIAGHSKSGTTALATFLAQHPRVFLPPVKEPNHFCPSWCRAPGPPSCFFPRTEAEYLALFDAAGPDQVCGEASAAYLYSPEAAALIHEFDPAARIVMIFREPVAFLRSYHLQLLKNTPTEGETVRDLGEAIALEPERRAGRRLPEGCLIPEMLWYSTDRLRYEEHFDRFAERFGRERILAFTYEEFRADNAAAVRRVLEFLGVDPDFEPRIEDHNTGGTALRSRRLQALLHRASFSGGAASRVRAMLPRRLRRRAITAAYDRFVFEQAPPLDPGLAAEIRAKATPHVEGLGKRLDRDLLDEWGYRASPAAGPVASGRE
jgi:hypothetical protein